MVLHTLHTILVSIIKIAPPSMDLKKGGENILRCPQFTINFCGALVVLLIISIPLAHSLAVLFFNALAEKLLY